MNKEYRKPEKSGCRSVEGIKATSAPETAERLCDGRKL